MDILGDAKHDNGPNVCGIRPSRSVGWHRHTISAEDSMARLALKYNTSIGLICRANRMHGQDVLQTRRHIWVPLSTVHCQVFKVQGPMQIGREEQQPLFTPSDSSSPYGRRSPSPPMYFRRSFETETDPLLLN